MDEVIRHIALTLDRPSIYMGGPSSASVFSAQRLVRALDKAGFEIVKRQEASE